MMDEEWMWKKNADAFVIEWMRGSNSRIGVVKSWNCHANAQTTKESSLIDYINEIMNDTTWIIHHEANEMKIQRSKIQFNKQ